MHPNYDPVLVLASIATAILASYVALDLAVLMGAAISGMHYTGMAAAQFAPASAAVEPGLLYLHSTGVSIAVIVGTVLILSLALAGAASTNARAFSPASSAHATTPRWPAG